MIFIAENTDELNLLELIQDNRVTLLATPENLNELFQLSPEAFKYFFTILFTIKKDNLTANFPIKDVQELIDRHILLIDGNSYRLNPRFVMHYESE